MKKIIFLLSALLLIGGSSFAQKKNVSKARAKILADPQDTKGAKDAILPALKDSTTNRDAITWFYAGEVFNAIYLEQQKIEWTQKKGDKELMANASEAALNYYLMADSLDQLPNKKGKIAPKYHTKIVDKIKGLQRNFTEGGSTFYEKKDFKNALRFFEKYLNYQYLPQMKGLGLEKDTLIPLITYYCGLCATQAELPAVAIKYYEQIKDTNADSKWIYARLCDDYSTLKDTVNMIRMFKLGASKFPAESYYTRSLINYYINQSKMDEALTWIDAAIDLDPKASILWNVKGRILETTNLEESKVCYQKSIDLDPNFAEALGNLGRIYYNKAVEELDRINAIKDDKKYRIEKAKLKGTFQVPLPYFEKAYELNPDERDYVIALRGIYYNLGQDAKYQEMDKKLKSM